MDFMKLLQSLDELLYEVMSWLVFFPLTLWRALTQPLAMMAYADRELHEREERQYDETLSPPLFLLLSLLLSHGIELALGSGTNPLVTRETGLAGLITDDSSLLVLRMLVFSLIPLTLAVCMVMGKGQRLTRERLRAPFYAQCFPAAPFALTIGLATLLTSSGQQPQGTVGAVLLLLALSGYFTLQVVWFRRQLNVGHVRAVGRVALAFAIALILLVLVGVLLA